jgi:hypothetical protein
VLSTPLRCDEAQAENEEVLLQIRDISFVMPARKKYDLCFTRHYLYARAAKADSPAPGMAYAWKDMGG